MQLTIAMVQMDIAPGDPEANLTRMDGFVARAAAKGAELVVFPEDAITGPMDNQTAFAHHAGEFLVRCAAMAAAHGVDLVPGSWSVPDAGALYNTAYYINSDGSLAGSYSKANLWETEKATITPGPGPVVVPTRHGPVGLAICWDIAHPAQFQAMAAMGAELVVSPTYWSLPRGAATGFLEKKEERDLIDALCLARAFEADVVLAYCNAAGAVGSREKGDDKRAGVLSGRSQLTHPHEKVLARARGNGEQVLVETFGHARAGARAGVPA
ncbi:MAG: carbon-nitrogen hydrolase family protein [Phycisphaerales bacterium JB060]